MPSPRSIQLAALALLGAVLAVAAASLASLDPQNVSGGESARNGNSAKPSFHYSLQ